MRPVANGRRLRRRAAWALAAAVLTGLAGCSSGTHAPTAASRAGVTATHGGTLVELPDGKGFAEVGVEDVRPATKAKSGRYVAYFIKPDGSGPLEPAPGDVTITPEGGKTVALAPAGGRFASEPGPYAPGQPFGGELSAAIAGATVKVGVQTR